MQRLNAAGSETMAESLLARRIWRDLWSTAGSCDASATENKLAERERGGEIGGHVTSC